VVVRTIKAGNQKNVSKEGRLENPCGQTLKPAEKLTRPKWVFKGQRMKTKKDLRDKKENPLKNPQKKTAAGGDQER